MGVSFIPPEFFGVSGIGKSLGEIGDQRRGDEETRRRVEREKLADSLAVEEAAIRRFKTINELALQSPGDQGLALRQHAIDGLATAGMVPTDVRLELTAEDINANQEALALATPASARTPEQWLMTGSRLGLPPGFTPETARLTVENGLKQEGFDLTILQSNQDERDRYKLFLEEQGSSPGQVQAQMAVAGIADLRAGTTLQASQAVEAEARGRLADAQATALLGEGASEVATARLRLLEPFFQTMADHGVDSRVAFKLANSQQLTEVEEKSVTDALASAARAASDTTDKMQILVDLLKVKHLSEGTHALAIVGLASELYGADVVTVEPEKNWWGGEKDTFAVNVNLELALSRMMSEDGKTGETRQTTEDLVRDMRNEVNSINTAEELEVAIAGIEEIQVPELKALLLQMVQERAAELEGGTAEVIEAQPGDISGFTEEETIREEQTLRQALITADEAGNVEEVRRIRGRLLELEQHRLSNFSSFGAGSLKERFTPNTGGGPVPANRQRIRGR
jgi:hypothetical protein